MATQGTLVSKLKTPRGVFAAVILALCAFMPIIAPALGDAFYIDVFVRIMIWAIAAVSLNLILGYGGMVSFGHACYLGIAGYTVGIMSYHEVYNGFIQWPAALLLTGVVALIFGFICLRTRGVYFIMITLALAQMIYFLSISLQEYGSDDGLSIDSRSEFFTGFDLSNGTTFYYLVFVLLVLCLFIVHRMINSRFGMVLQGTRSNEVRMQAIGFPVFRYRLASFVIAGMMCGLAGILHANFEGFVSPDMMHWTRSGELIFMVVLGGMGTIIGPVTGALIFLLLSDFLAELFSVHLPKLFSIFLPEPYLGYIREHVLQKLGEHWHIVFGVFLILVVLFARGGIDGIVGKLEKSRG